jgi:hypothetical protein
LSTRHPHLTQEVKKPRSQNTVLSSMQNKGYEHPCSVAANVATFSVSPDAAPTLKPAPPARIDLFLDQGSGGFFRCYCFW